MRRAGLVLVAARHESAPMTAGDSPIETAAFSGIGTSRLIKGAWQLHERARDLDRAAALADMHAFADAGITTFEAADVYEGVEALVGEFADIRRALRQSGVRVHTRLTVPTAGSLSADVVARAVDQARQRLRTQRLDLVQLSMWQFDRARWTAAARHIADLAARGAVDRLGVMNVDAD